MEILVNGFRWRVVPTSDRKLLEREDGVVTLGVTDRRMMCIFIWSGLRGDMLRKVLVHELCHAYIFSYGYAFPPEYEEMACKFVHSHGWDIVDAAERLYAQVGRNVMKL